MKTAYAVHRPVANSYLVRERNRRRLRELAVVLVAVGCLGGGLLAYTWIQPAVIRRVVVGLLGSLIALVGPSRVYLGHHWFTDVSASYLLGFTWLIGLTSLYRRVKNIQVSLRRTKGGKRFPLW